MTPFKCVFALLLLFLTPPTLAAPRYHPEAARLYDAGLRALAHGDQEKARTALEKAVTLDVSLADAHCVLGLIYKGAEETPAAAEAFQRATIADENYIEAYYELGDVLLVHLGDTAQATRILRKAVAMDANHARIRTLLGIAYFRDNLTDAAVRELQHALKLDPTSLTARYTLGNAFLQQEAWQSAIETFKALIDIDPFHAKAHFSLGTAYRRIGETEVAQRNLQRFEVLSIEEEQLTHLKRFVQLNPTTAEPWYRLGRIQLKRQLWVEATQSLERYVALAPQETRGYEALGYIHFQEQNYKQAVAMYQKAIQRKPDVATYRNSLAGAYLMLKQYPEAIEHYQTAIHLKPSEPRFYLNLSKAYELAGAHAEAEKTYQEYERLTSKSTSQ
jgi:tetratricopeptide (TPR) repeat protein